MNKQLRDEWVRALRSGGYMQGQRRMQNSDGSLCCLAVLCRTAGVEYPPGAYDLSSSRDLQAFRDACGLDQFREGDHPEMLMEELVQLNDSRGLSFRQIADWIEANIPVTP